MTFEKVLFNIDSLTFSLTKFWFFLIQGLLILKGKEFDIKFSTIVAVHSLILSAGEGGFKIPSFGGEEGGLSMADVKKYGVSGTIAYVLTELAFWAVAFPVASTTYYQSFGHWPDVINDGSDRTAVLGFIFAGANIARLLVPLRLGAALALAPWVDENILNRDGTDSNKSEGEGAR